MRSKQDDDSLFPIEVIHKTNEYLKEIAGACVRNQQESYIQSSPLYFRDAGADEWRPLRDDCRDAWAQHEIHPDLCPDDQQKRCLMTWTSMVR